jgi:hypothetical protein
VSLGDRNRNSRLERLRALVPVSNAIIGIDLAGVKLDEIRAALTDHWHLLVEILRRLSDVPDPG